MLIHFALLDRVGHPAGTVVATTKISSGDYTRDPRVRALHVKRLGEDDSFEILQRIVNALCPYWTEGWSVP